MGKCCSKAQEGQLAPLPKKQNKDINDKKMLKVGMDIMGRDLSVQIGYNRIAKKMYSDSGPSTEGTGNRQENS